MRRLYFVKRLSVREIARRTGRHRETVRRAVEAEEPPRYVRPPRVSKLDSYRGEIERLLREEPRLPGRRVRELIGELGYQGVLLGRERTGGHHVSTQARPQRVGSLRPSALIHTFGVGAAVELPRLAVMVMGLDEWRREGAAIIEEPRLLRAIQQEPGLREVQRLLAPPIADSDGPAGLSGLDASRSIGVPVGVFPRWLVCPVCRRLAPIEGGQFELKLNAFRPERSQYVHRNCQRARGAPQRRPQDQPDENSTEL